MKTNSLIIDLRRQLPWHKRYVSTTSTAMMWGGWLLLWRPFVFVWLLVELQKTHLVHRLFSAFGVGIEHGFTALIACAIGLLLWSHILPERRVGGDELDMKQTDDYARYFDLPEQEIEQGRSQKITIVHHDEFGKIVRVE
ncbi:MULTISPECIES: poly-beta-1,6-N-acetyl-D-glucosamine biosynthesis protein PgaD [Acinetobacter]|uniref:Poly-beta-1,6-N-acetyl-D-glucosamine biosynthesis protein PgaD n=2 Tax=Acinetobacter TaxID=469 RepID=N8S8L3_9GAMM|nr:MULTISPECIES: poly-beta-1,6-N-acetyl-D-glucosamine biosynthesis protein PgaD [Acinetobacter]KHO14750.1 poly-beta-1,6-N-acetyl-D-glucosamine biosynthesis protein PgaD [Acinetobacter baumannii]ENU42707.1 poly-beta-1,6-N-acetyl-D-glucosamine biosynthesis protein PgaD [Acinetobacter seifertii]MBD1225561.1 poly-beta-1,6-N-acetyl-D-glucosamine biosynthesis protein PgaD [Acinetobacter seifertii]MBD1230655.1 poly-beta-1,6-N-acetyl-D-glucosamine biosynthesis protein PgaD [Acinetobacter seifertii]MBJ